MVTKKKNTYVPLQKILTFAGLAIIILGIASSIFYVYRNHGFIYDFLDLSYYLNYLILLVGGFVVGYLVMKKSNRLFGGVLYAFLAMSLYGLFDVVRFASQNLFGQVAYPWSRIIFNGMAPGVLILTILIAVIVRYLSKANTGSLFAKLLFILALLGVQLFYLVLYWHDFATVSQNYGSTAIDVMFTIFGFLINPVVATLVTYLLFSGVKSKFDRLFYATFIGGFAEFLMYLLQNFRTDPTANATNIFESVIILITVVATALLVWRSRKALR